MILHRHGTKIIGYFAILFGLMTLKEGSSVLFFDGSARAEAGNYVPFVLIFNTIAGFFYVFAGIGILLKKNWAKKLAATIAFSSAIVLAAFILHIALGHPYEIRTAFAMPIRTIIWFLIAFFTRSSRFMLSSK